MSVCDSAGKLKQTDGDGQLYIHFYTSGLKRFQFLQALYRIRLGCWANTNNKMLVKVDEIIFWEERKKSGALNSMQTRA